MSELVQAYGTKEAPLSIEQARAKIRSDFTRFAQMVINGVTLPAGHVFAQSPALGIDHQLTWYLGCEIESANAGLSVFGHLAVADDKDSNQLHIEARYFHPELHFRDENGKAKSSRAYNPGYGAHLWVDQGRPYWGMNRSLIEGRQFLSNVPTVETMAEEVVARLNHAISARAQPHEAEAVSGL